MGRIIVKIKVKNLIDEIKAKEGVIKPQDIREIITDGLVDTGATMFCLPIDMIEKLGLEQRGTREVRTANGTVTRRVFVGALVEIQGREGEFSVLELPVGMMPLVGQVVLEELDLYPDPKNGRLTGRPDSPDKMVIDCYITVFP